MTDTDRLLGIQEAADILGIHLETLRRWSNEGKVETVLTPGKHRRYRRSDIEALVSRKKAEWPPETGTETTVTVRPEVQITLRCSEEITREILAAIAKIIKGKSENEIL